jgi:hypothetical protein
MTRAPANLLAVRTLLLTHLDNAPGPDDLDPGEVGIVGDSAHRGGYHCGSDRTVTNDYSVFESPRDRAGLTLDAAALDVGQFNVRSGGRTHNLPSFSLWCVAQCAANAADTRDIREIIYSPDGSTVKRWDRLGKRTSGDSSHRWHTHFSFFRDAIKAGRDQRPLFRRYLTEIGLLEDDTVTPEDINKVADAVVAKLATPDTLKKVLALDVLPNGYGDAATNTTIAAGTLVRNLARDTEATKVAVVDRVALDAKAVADAISATLARQVAEELARRLLG